MRSFAMWSALLLTLGACTSPASAPSLSGERQILGSLALTVDPTLTAGTPASRSSALSPQAVLGSTDLGFEALTFSSVDVAGIRYLSATYRVTNTTARPLSNVTLHAYTKPSDNTGGTAFQVLQDSANTPLSASAAQGILPAHGTVAGSWGVRVDPDKADFQAFSSAEAGAVQTEAGGTGLEVLEYGYVVRSADNLNSRTLAASNAGTSDEGRVTVGLRVPLNGANTAYRFVLRFIVAEESTNRVTRGREESAAEAAARAQTLGASELLLVGPDSEPTTFAGTVKRQANARIGTAPTNLYRDPTSIPWQAEKLAESVGLPWGMQISGNRVYFTVRDSTPNVRLRSVPLDSATFPVDFASVGRTYQDANSALGSSAPATNWAVRDEGEGGVLGFTFDPTTASKVYVCYSYYNTNTVSDTNRRNRVSSFTLNEPTSGSSGVLTNEQIVLDDMLGWSNHNGCRVAYGPDGKLYVTMGEAESYPYAGPSDSSTYSSQYKAQDLTQRSGKIFRVGTDGSVPSDNPFFSNTSSEAEKTRSLIWTSGHRNPQGLAFNPWDSRLWSTEHGAGTRDELNRIESGKNYGWPVCIGTQTYNEGTGNDRSADGKTYRCPFAAPGQAFNNAPNFNLTSSTYLPAVREYDPGETKALSDVAFYTSTRVPEWRGNLLMTSLKAQRLYRVGVQGNAVSGPDQILIEGTYGRLRDVLVGPDGRIYLSTDSGEIWRLTPNL